MIWAWQTERATKLLGRTIKQSWSTAVLSRASLLRRADALSVTESRRSSLRPATPNTSKSTHHLRKCLNSPALQASPTSLKRWITSRTVSSSASTGRAMTGTVLPPAEASRIIFRR